MSDEKEMKEISISGYSIMYTEKEDEGIYYLNDHLDRECVDVIIYYAKERSSGAPFLDCSGHKFLLTKKDSSHFVLTKK